MKLFYAHSKTDQTGNLLPEFEWEPLFSTDCGTLAALECEQCEGLDPNHGHLNKVAYLAGKFASEMFPKDSKDSTIARQWGQLAGWWHDLGKFAPEWQEYLKLKSDPHADEIAGKVDHSTAGAQHAVNRQSILGHLLAFGIAGHHSGLLDSESNHACQWTRLQKPCLPEIKDVPTELKEMVVPTLPSCLIAALKSRSQRDAYAVSLFTRMLFSCLVDADFIATESFMNPTRSRQRNQTPAGIFQQIEEQLSQKISKFGTPDDEDTVNQMRSKVLDECQRAASQPTGLFTLTVPTGGGKTLSSFAFALRHALVHGQKRIIFVVPFTSIIEQNAEVLRKIVAPLETENFTPLIEHHSSFDPNKESAQSRLAAENWDAPVIITTAVQFYESLFASRISRSRKVHNIANSVIILDEAQTLPVDFLQPCLRVLEELTESYNTTCVLCTATQPAIQFDKDHFPVGLRNCREIIKDTASIFAALRRVEVIHLGPVSDARLVKQLNDQEQSLCIVNRRRHAQQIFRLMRPDSGNFHLSALMCPEHRWQKLAEIRKLLAESRPVRLISTQLIEAGVDVDFPVVYRALAGLDSIAQAAGRCNRNGKLHSLGRTFVFKPEDERAEAYFRETAQVAAQLVELHADLLSMDAIRQYFDLYYYNQKSRWDEHGILDDDSLRFNGQNPKLPFVFNFKTIASRFRLINDWQIPVIIPYDERARNLISELSNPAIPLHRNLLRSLQRYTVQISPKLLSVNLSSFESLRDGQFHSLISSDLHYSDDFGLTLNEEYTVNQALIC